MDHPFRISDRALNKATAYVFFLGEDHTIFWHGGTRTKSREELRLALTNCELRFKRLGVSPPLP